MARAKLIYTVGYEGRQSAEFITLLKGAGIRRLLDVRCNPISRKPGFSKNTLKDALAEAGIEYVHQRLLGIPTEYRADVTSEDGRNRLFDFYRDTLLPQQDTEIWRAAELVSEMPTALMCFELDHLMCHRHVLAAELSQRTGMRIRNL